MGAKKVLEKFLTHMPPMLPLLLVTFKRSIIESRKGCSKLENNYGQKLKTFDELLTYFQLIEDLLISLGLVGGDLQLEETNLYNKTLLRLSLFY